MSLPFAMALAESWRITEKLARDWLAIKPAIKQSVDSQLPGRENGPADAYRHLLWGAELTRKFGADVARRILETHEIQGDLSTRVGLGSQSPAAAAMDRHNNVLAVKIGQTARTWNDVEQGAREVIERSRGDGPDAGAVWLPEAQWSSHLKDPSTGRSGRPSFGTGLRSTGKQARSKVIPPIDIPTVAKSIATSRQSTTSCRRTLKMRRR